MVRDFQPFFDLWTTASNWVNWREKWLNDPLVSIDPELLERNVSDAHKTMHKCFKQFKELPGESRVHQRLEKSAQLQSLKCPLQTTPFFPSRSSTIPDCQAVAALVRSRIEDFLPCVPVIQGLRNPGMRSRHWEMLSERTQIKVMAKANLTFSRCLELGLHNFVDDIATVAEIAGKEFTIEQVYSFFLLFTQIKM